MSRFERASATAAADATDAEFVAVLESEHVLLARVAFSVLRNEDDANDALSDAVAKTYARWRKGGIDDLPRYLTRAVKNTALGRARKRRSQIRALELLTAQAETSGAADDSYPTEFDTTTLRSKFEELSSDCQTIIKLRIYEQVPVKEVAALLLISQGTVKSRCSRCLRQLGRSLGA